MVKSSNWLKVETLRLFKAERRFLGNRLGWNREKSSAMREKAKDFGTCSSVGPHSKKRNKGSTGENPKSKSPEIMTRRLFTDGIQEENASATKGFAIRLITSIPCKNIGPEESTMKRHRLIGNVSG